MKKGITIFITVAILIVLAIVGLKLLLAQYDMSDKMAKTSETTETSTRVLLETNYGNITIQLRSDQPITAGNFESLVKKGTYNGVIFHRIIAGFMIQGGDPTGTGYGDSSIPKIKDEFNGDQSNGRGTLSMANAGPNTGSSQFFINLIDNNFLDGKHPVFGDVVEGMDIVDTIAKVKTGANDKPLKDVKIIKASVL